MPVLAQTFLALVGRHFMTFVFFTVRHDNYFLLIENAFEGLNAGTS